MRWTAGSALHRPARRKATRPIRPYPHLPTAQCSPMPGHREGRHRPGWMNGRATSPKGEAQDI